MGIQERQNAAKAGGVSLMALSLAACGGSSTPVAVAPVVADPVVPVVDAVKALAFTSNLDTLTGGSGDDVFNGVYYANGGTGTTAFPGDSVVGGAGADTLNIAVAGTSTAATSINAISTDGVENLLITNYDANTNAHDTTVDTSLMTGLTNVGLTASSALGDTIISNLVSVVSAELRNGSGDLTLTYTTDAVKGTADEQSLTVSNLTAGTFDAAGVETVSASSVLAKSTVAAITSDAMTTLNISGDQNLTITSAIDFKDAAVATANDGTVDASSFTGNLTIGLNASDVVTVTGGSGDDTIDMTSGLDKNDTIDGGAGDDTVVVNGSETAALANISNVEAIEIETDDIGGGVTVEISGAVNAGITTFVADANTASDGDVATLNFTNLDNGDTIQRSVAPTLIGKLIDNNCLISLLPRRHVGSYRR